MPPTALELGRLPGRVSRGIGAWLLPRPIILMYHRVADLAFDPQLLAVRPSHFHEHLQVMRSTFRPMSLTDLGRDLEARRFPRRGVVVTIDDGYADNLENARPLLEAFDVPATVFIATGCLQESREFWWDELERLVLVPRTLPETIEVTVEGRVHAWQLGDASTVPVGGDDPDRDWNVEDAHDPGPRQVAYRSLYALLHPLPDEAKRPVLEELRRTIGADAERRPTHRTLTADQLLDLAAGDGIEIGAHTVTHPALAGLPVPAQEDEIRRSRDDLQGLLGRQPKSFAFPHGSFSRQTVTAVRDAGFALACTSEPALVAPTTDPLHLPRLVPRDWDGDTFGRWLRDRLG